MTKQGERILHHRPWSRHDWLALLLCLAPLLLICRLMLQYAVNVPFWDNWRMLILPEVDGRGLLAHWKLANEHRMLIPRLLDVLLARASGFNVILWVWAKVPVVVCLTAVEYLIFRRHSSRTQAWLMLPWLAVFNLSLVYWPLWIDPRPLGSHLALLGFIFGLWALTGPGRGWPRVILAIVGAVVSSLSFASGNSTWLILAAVLWLVGYRKPRFYLAWGLSALAVLVPYAIDIVRSHTHLREATAPSLGAIVRYVLVFIGSPVSATHSKDGVAAATWIGLFGLVAAAVIIALVIRYIKGGAEASIAWISLLVWVWIEALAAGLGRASIGLHQALARRYVNTSSGFWLALVALCVVGLWGRRSARCGKWTGRMITVLGVLIMATIGVCVAQANAAAVSGNRLTAFSQRLERGRQCLQEFETADDTCLGLLSPRQDFVRTLVGRLAPSRPSFLQDQAGAPEPFSQEPLRQETP